MGRYFRRKGDVYIIDAKYYDSGPEAGDPGATGGADASGETGIVDVVAGADVAPGVAPAAASTTGDAMVGVPVVTSVVLSVTFSNPSLLNSTGLKR